MMTVRVVRAVLRVAVLLVVVGVTPANMLASAGPMPPPPVQSSASS